MYDGWNRMGDIHDVALYALWAKATYTEWFRSVTFDLSQIPKFLTESEMSIEKRLVRLINWSRARCSMLIRDSKQSLGHTHTLTKHEKGVDYGINTLNNFLDFLQRSRL